MHPTYWCNFRQNNPTAGISEARKQYYTENNCAEAIVEPHYEGIDGCVFSQQLLNVIENYHLK